MVLYFRYIWLYSSLIKVSGDLEKIRVQNLCHVKGSSKVFLLRAYISIYKFDVICLSKTFLNSDTAFDDDSLKIKGYHIVRSDHTSNSRRGGVCMDYKQ